MGDVAAPNFPKTLVFADQKLRSEKLEANLLDWIRMKEPERPDVLQSLNCKTLLPFTRLLVVNFWF